MEFISYEKQKKFVRHSHTITRADGKETTRTDEDEELPLIELSNSLQALSKLVCKIEELPLSLHGQISPYKVKVAHKTKNGTRSLQIWYNRTYEELGVEKTKDTPAFRIDKAEPGENGVVVLDAEDINLVAEFISHATDYIQGKRQQMTFDEWEKRDEAITPKEDEGDLTLES